MLCVGCSAAFPSTLVARLPGTFSFRDCRCQCQRSFESDGHDSVILEVSRSLWITEECTWHILVFIARLENDFSYLQLCLKGTLRDKMGTSMNIRNLILLLKFMAVEILWILVLIQTLSRDGVNSEIWWLVQTRLWISRGRRSYTTFGLSYCNVSSFAFYFCHGKTRMRVQSYKCACILQGMLTTCILRQLRGCCNAKSQGRVRSLPGVLVRSEMRKILWCLQEFCASPSW